MAETDVSLERSLYIWWAFVWRSVLAACIVGGVLGLIAGLILGATGAPNLAAPIGAVLGWLSSIPTSIFAFKHALCKRYSGFHIVVVEGGPTDRPKGVDAE